MTKRKALGAPRLRNLKIALAVASAGVAMIAGSASASIVFRTYEFTATGFTAAGGGGGVAPVDPVSGSFTLTFDNSATIIESSAITVNSLNLTLSSAIIYTYVQPVDSLIIGGAAGGANDFPNPGDFWIELFSVSNDSTGADGVYYTTPSGFITKEWQSGNVSTRSFEGAPSIPEPSTWALLVGGFAAAGATLRRRRPGLRTSLS